MPLLESRSAESNLGNWVTDTMVQAWRGKTPGGKEVRIALANSGGIRSSIDKGNITMADLLAAFPFENTYDAVVLLGKHIIMALEHSVVNMDENGGGTSGAFLQVSGLRVTYDLREPMGSRVVRVEVVEEAGGWAELEAEREYGVVVSSYLATGGDGYQVSQWQQRSGPVTGSLDTAVMLHILEEDGPVTSEVEGRITVITAKSATSENTETSAAPESLSPTADSQTSQSSRTLMLDIGLVAVSVLSTLM